MERPRRAVPHTAQAAAVRDPLLHPRSPTVTSSRSDKPPTHRETGGPPTGHRSTPAGNPTEPRRLGVTKTAIASHPAGSDARSSARAGRPQHQPKTVRARGCFDVLGDPRV